MSSNWMQDLRYIVMSCNEPTPGHEKEYAEAYKCWRAAWEKLRTETHVNETLYADCFVIPHEMGALFKGDECIGLSCFTYGDLKSGPTKDHSYFKGWSEMALHKLGKISTNVVLCSQFTINPAYTGKNHEVRWKEILSVYTLLRFYHSQAEVMAGQLNLARKMNEVGDENFGATVLEKSLPYYYAEGINVMLVAYQKHLVEKMITEKHQEDLCHTLWEKMVHLSKYIVTEENILEKKVA